MSICANTTYEKKKFGISLFADDRMSMTAISAFGALVASRFSNTTSLNTSLKPVRPVSNVTSLDTSCHSKLYHEQLNPEWR
jgi:hypothetical protein